MSHSTVRRIWNDYRVRPRRFESWPARPDPRSPLAATDIVGVFLRPPDRALAFSLGPREPGVPVAARLPAREASLPSGLDRMVWADAPLVPEALVTREREFLRFLATLARPRAPDRELRVVASGPGLAASRAVARWRTRHPRIDLEFAEPPTSWPARLAPHLGEIAHRSGLPRNFGGRGELARAVRLFLTSYREEAGPFEWVASPREMAAGEAGYRLRYELSATGHPGFKSPPTVPARVTSSAAPDPRAREMAQVVLRKSLRVRPKERVTIATWTETLEFANAFVLESLRIGARPLLIYQDEPTYWAAASEVRPSRLGLLGDHARAALRRSDVFIDFFGPSDRERFHALPGALCDRLSEAQDDLYEAAARGGARAVQLALGRASAASARMYAVDLETWRKEVIEATLVDPAELHRRAARLVEPLRSGSVLTIRHPNGTELELGLKRRRPQVSDGRIEPAHRGSEWNLLQLPAGVVSVALDEHVAEGTFVSNVTNSVGVMDSVGEVATGRWVFERGRLAHFRYEQGQELFRQSYARAGPGKERPGVLSIGLNDRLATAPLLLDQGAGTVTLQLGRNDVAGGSTSTFWWAWLLLRGADVAVDGERLVRAGRLVP